MKIDYNIIWVEDKIDSKAFKRLIKRIKTFLTQQFFNVNIVTAEDFDEFKENFEQHSEFDLVITDLNLNEGKGSDVINFVRKAKNDLTEIFFYSANDEVSDVELENSSRISFYRLDNHNLYRTLQTKLEELISLTISKFQHIVSMRGMIMHETSSLDLQMSTIVKSQIKNPDLKEKLSPTLNKIFESILKNAEEKFNKAKSRKLKDILRDNVLFNSSQKVFALGAILDVIGIDNFAKEYEEEIILIRNQFAHAELIKSKEGKEFFRIKGEEVYFDADFCRKIRKDIIKHKTNLDKLSDKLGLN